MALDPTLAERNLGHGHDIERKVDVDAGPGWPRQGPTSPLQLGSMTHP